MEKKKIAYVLLFIYEVIQLCFVLIIKAEESIAILPLSWYAGAALLCIPLLLCFFLYLDEYSYKVFLPLFALLKICTCIAFIAYIITDIPYILTYGAFNGYYSLKTAAFLLLFIVFNAILTTAMFRRNASIAET